MSKADTDIPELQVEEEDGLIALTQTGAGEYPDRVYLHPIHLRYLAERFGIIEAGDQQAARRIATLERRLRKMQDRVGHLAWHLCNLSDDKHADLDWEKDYSTATAEIGEEFCADLGQPLDRARVTSPAAPSARAARPAPSAGAGESKSAAERARDYRERKRAGVTANVTQPRDASRDVTGQTPLELEP